MGIFKAYDIRGVYPSELNEEIAYKIGRAFVSFLHCKEVVVGRDARSCSPQLFEALADGITDEGSDMIDIGLSTTPMLYYAGHGREAAIMITASHNPKDHNGFKMCRRDSIPVSGDTGIKEIESLAGKNMFSKKTKGKIIKKDILDEYIDFNLGLMDRMAKDKLKRLPKKFTVVLDAANAMGSLDHPKVYEKLGCRLIKLYCDLDMTFPNHEANPLKHETLAVLQKTVVENKADFGVAVDGDADRCVLVDEKGGIVSADLLTALIGKHIMEKHPAAKILFDLRSSMAVKETIEKAGGKAIMCRVGHAFIKKQMKEEDALFAGELSGHFYYKEHFTTESTILTVLKAIEIMLEENKPLSELIKPLRKYYQSGEINFAVKDKEAKINELEQLFGRQKNAEVSHLDGISIDFGGWRLNVRPSNTESLLRLNIEAKTKEKMEEMKEKLSSILSKGAP